MKPENLERDMPLSSDDSRTRDCGVFKSFYTGYRYIFLEIARLLRERPDFIPTEQNVIKALSAEKLRYDPGNTSNYFDFFFDKGGRVLWALECLLLHVRRTGPPPDGDDSFAESFDPTWPYPSHHLERWSLWTNRAHLREEWEQLPECTDDTAYDLISRITGICQRA